MPQAKNSWLNNCTHSPNLVLFLVLAWEVGSFRFPTKILCDSKKTHDHNAMICLLLVPVDKNICLNSFGAICFKQHCTCLTCILSSFHRKFNVISILQIWSAHFSMRYKNTSLISVKAWTKLMLVYIYNIYYSKFEKLIFQWDTNTHLLSLSKLGQILCWGVYIYIYIYIYNI